MKILNFIERECSFLFLGVQLPFSIIPLKHRKNRKKYITFWKLKIIFYPSNYSQGENSRLVPQKPPLIIYNKHRESYRKRWFFMILHSKKVIYFYKIAVFGGRGIIRADFWRRTANSHPAYSSKDKKDDFSFPKIYIFLPIFAIF